MKKKSFHKKLRLNKKTIVHLSEYELNNAIGGGPDTETCVPCLATEIPELCPSGHLCTREGTPC